MDEDLPEKAQSLPTQFDGDFFGGYDPADFEDFDEYQGKPEDADDDALEDGSRSDDGLEDKDEEDAAREEEDAAEEDADDLEDEAGWEPPVPLPTAHTAAQRLADFGEELHAPPLSENPPRSSQHRIQEHLRAPRTFHVRFPGVHAGRPNSDDHDPSSYETYQAEIDPENHNPYHPFASRIDWEVARWAKMRGPGSTAVTELLEIENVR